MTEQTLGEAIEIKKRIDGLRRRKAEIEKVLKWCEGREIHFSIHAMEAGGISRDSTMISAEEAKNVLDKEIKGIEKELEALLNELSELH